MTEGPARTYHSNGAHRRAPSGIGTYHFTHGASPMVYSTHRSGILARVCLLSLLPLPASATFHFWDVTEVYSNADGSVQFVEFFTTSNSQDELFGEDLTSNANTYTFPHDLGATDPVGNPNGGGNNATANQHFLVATPGFASIPGAPAPDYVLDAENFFDTVADTLTLVFADSLAFTSGELPTDGVNSLNEDFGGANRQSAANSPTNFAGVSGSIDLSGPPSSITLGHADHFQEGGVENWAGGSNPVNQPTGGPDGAGDHYLEISAVSFNLGTFNAVQWSGDYDAEGVDTIDFDLNNFGPDSLSLRVVLFTPGCDLGGAACTAWTSTNATALASGSGWVTASFSLAEADMTRVLGSDSHTASLQNVERLLIRHDDGAPDPPGSGPLVTATLGIDNVTALPEPSGLSGLLAGGGALAALRRRRSGLA